jgi:hypothetical protein
MTLKFVHWWSKLSIGDFMWIPIRLELPFDKSGRRREMISSFY